MENNGTCVFFNQDSFDYKFHTMKQLHKRRFQMLSSNIGLFPGQPPLLMLIYQNNGCTQNELSKKLNIKPASMTEALKRMEKAGLIERRCDEKDLRLTRVFLSATGNSLVQEALEIGKQIEKECFINFTEEEKKTFLRLMDNLNSGLKKIIEESK